MHEQLARTLESVRQDFDALYRTRIPAFNETAHPRGLLQLMTVTEPDEREPVTADDDEEDPDADGD